ncbi:hypothetical protein DFS34DRAFT_615280 [Phlyctochytrium arcticum]|nr:hypothetical protein DFS34DRAFT_615280 [Phlyctochytrium arcticum]
MGRKVVYKLALKAMPSPALTSLPKRTRSLLLQIQVAKESKQYDEADRLLGELGDLYEEVGDVEKMIDVAKQELEVGDNLGPKDGAKARNRAYFRLSRGYRELECFDAAIDSAKEYIKSSQYLQDNSELLQGYFELALTYTARWESHEQSPSDNEDAESAWRSAAALLKWLPRDKKEDIKADINLNLGITLKNASEYDRSLLHMNKALEHYIKSGNKSDEAKAYFNISAVHHAKGQGDQSIHYAWKEQKLLHEMGDLQSEARSYWELAIRCKDYWHYEEAIGALKAYKSLCDMLDDDEGTAQATTAITDAQECIEKEGRIQDLTLRLNAAKHGSVPLRKQFDLYGERGELLLGLGKHALAIYDFEEQKRLAFLLKLPKLPTEKLLYHLGLSYAGENRHEEALKAYREALDKFEGTGAERLVILLKLADSYQETSGPYELMCRTYDQVVTLAEQLGDLEMQREALSQLVWINQKRGFEAKAAGFQARLSDVEAIIEAAGTSLGNDESMEPELGSADPDMLRDAGSDSGPRNGIPSSTSIPNNSVAPRKTATIPQPVAPAKPKDRTAKYQIHTIVDDLSLDFDQSNPPSPSKTKRKPRVSIPQPTPITIIDSDSDTGIDEFPATSAAAPRVGNGAKNVLNEDEDDEEADIPLLPRSGLSGTSSPFSNRKSLTAKRKESPPSSKRAVIKKSRLRIDSSSPPPSQSQRSQQLLFPRSTGNASIRATVSREEDENRDLSMLPLNMR